MSDSSTSGRGNLARTLVVSAAVLAVLLLGAAVGLLINLPGSRDSTAPAADSVDVGFCQDMATHHLQGVQMANIARDKSTDPAVKGLAFDISSTQLEQVGRMKGWLMLWGQPEQSNTGVHMKWMESATHGHGSSGEGAGAALMPGMATNSELAKLRSMQGKELDVYFLQLMLRHHQGGAPMSEYATKRASQHVVQTLADNIIKHQGPEETLIKQMLNERGAAPLP